MSRLPFELLLALRYLRPKRTFVSIITLISVVGVMLGVAVLIIVISVMSGFDRDLKEKVFGFNAHLKVLARGRTMENYAMVASAVASNRNVKGVAPFVLAQVLLETQPASGQAMVLAPMVRGMFDAGYFEFNASVVIASLENAQAFYDLEDSDSVHGLMVALNDPYQAQRVADELERTLGGEFKVTTWMEESPLMMAVLVEK